MTVASLKHQWAREIERFCGERAVVVSGGAPSRRHALASDAPYKILNYELTWRELTLLESLDADVVIYDEAQRAKNFRTKTARTLRSIPSRFVFVLTGTPVENRLDDLYSLLQLVDPSVLGPLWRFNLDFHEQTENGKITGYKNLSRLRERIAPVVLRRRKEEVLHQLPPLTEQTRHTPLTVEQKELESGYRADAAILLSIADRRPLSKEEQQRLMMLLIKARQACTALELCDPKRKQPLSPKLDEFEALIGEIVSQSQSKVLVFSEWTEMLRLAARRLDSLAVGYAMLHGGVPADRRPALLDRFRESADLRVLLSTDAGGVGLNLQVASYVVHLDLPWNPARLDQRTARAHRLGQTRGVCVTYLCAEEGIERAIEKTLAGKRAVRSAALDPTSDVETLEAPSFSLFLRQMRDVLAEMGDEGREPEVAEDAETVPPLALAGSTEGSDALDVTSLPERAALDAGRAAAALPAPTSSASPVATSHALNRLQLAQVVLSAGFFGDAVRAAYEALAAAISGLVEGGASPEGHATLVAAIYRHLLPSGRLPAAAPGVLAKLHDLASLGLQDIAVERSLAEDAVREASEWVARLTPSR